MAKFLLWLVWVVELLLFLFGAGCVVVLFGSGEPRYSSQAVVALVLLIASVALCGYAVYRAARGLVGAEPTPRLALFLSLPIVAAFAFSGSCVLLVNAL